MWSGLRELVADLLLICGRAVGKKHDTSERFSRLIYPILAAIDPCVIASISGSPVFAMPKPAMIFSHLPQDRNPTHSLSDDSAVQPFIRSKLKKTGNCH